MLSFILRRLGTMALTMLCLTLIVFFLINLNPNLKKLAISQTEMHTSAEQLEDWLVNHGYRQNFFVRYGQWLGVLPKQPVTDPATGKPTQRLNGSAASASQGITFYNFTLPVMTLAIYGIGYIARMTRASMVEVMTQQYIRTARLKGLSFGSVVVKHALRNALIAPFTVIMLQFPWLLTGVVIVEVMFRYQGFGYTLVEAAGNNDIDLLLGCSLVSVFIVLITQLISDVG
ncbi:MAG: ABC transporter permease, partial [Mesorhizobium sp.]